MGVVVGVVVVAALIGGALLALREQGPNRAAVLLRRYGPWPAVALVLGAAAAVLVVSGRERWLVMGVLVGAWAALVAAVGGWLTVSGCRVFLRRAVLRSRWPSVARAAGLGQTLDRRSKG